ncbi:DUF5958 family protein [Flavobacterium johnsoniae]|uniref:Uncharacterized protein n=1 Tax=Flavobacterium johnsoniae (strain ATCC 17061 / DSM 2064 / JCM 8514 / BCRC 14874 / CCUG 350202 / NBRC 14942 / NCIMB 11054 / UW101) TaxID=376686 RepID=A5FDP2_FLAJ1|nr:DUF5958 family protein [Flavobacterium johnsoniae]ABQ06677.1 hypothetical protein Fjoh_3663 [Flavobacterium johnsoniae UW101]OXE99916.1 hypothetical protein B0A63_11495 [Flavobacterium johnsoniae UW101]WQG82434.1 DUF5958 family protein [Flavobacterium johnsoniae UW101]SHM01159.1 hypothetical protein SAMN05444146_5171 [Flavobacterium johnsoniae]
MELLKEIQVNKFGQNLVEINDLSNVFSLLTLNEKKEFLNDILFLIMQSKPKEEDIENAIKESNLKKTYTPCILIQKGVANHNLKKLLELPENEINKSFILLLHLFKISYSRRFEIEKNDENKWWYWDLSDDEKVKAIIENRGIL